jgi:hypothetical protein
MKASGASEKAINMPDYVEKPQLRPRLSVWFAALNTRIKRIGPLYGNIGSELGRACRSDVDLS